MQQGRGSLQLKAFKTIFVKKLIGVRKVYFCYFSLILFSLSAFAILVPLYLSLYIAKFHTPTEMYVFHIIIAFPVPFMYSG